LTEKEQEMEIMDTLNYIVESIAQKSPRAPAQLRIVKNPRSDLRTDVSPKLISDALFRHCRTSKIQLEELKKDLVAKSQ